MLIAACHLITVLLLLVLLACIQSIILRSTDWWVAQPITTLTTLEVPAITPGGYVYRLTIQDFYHKVHRSTIRVEQQVDILEEQLRLTKLYQGKLLSCNLITEEEVKINQT